MSGCVFGYFFVTFLSPYEANWRLLSPELFLLNNLAAFAMWNVSIHFNRYKVDLCSRTRMSLVLMWSNLSAWAPLFLNTRSTCFRTRRLAFSFCSFSSTPCRVLHLSFHIPRLKSRKDLIVATVHPDPCWNLESRSSG